MEIKRAEMRVCGDEVGLDFVLNVPREEVPKLSRKIQEINKYELRLMPKREAKSKQSVNYFWSKVVELADKTTKMGTPVTKDLVYESLLRDYGQCEVFSIDREEIILSLQDIYRIVDVAGKMDDGILVKCYRGISRLDKDELKVLIDGVKYELGQIE